MILIFSFLSLLFSIIPIRSHGKTPLSKLLFQAHTTNALNANAEAFLPSMQQQAPLQTPPLPNVQYIPYYVSTIPTSNGQYVIAPQAAYQPAYYQVG